MKIKDLNKLNQYHLKHSFAKHLHTDANPFPVSQLLWFSKLGSFWLKF